MIPEIATLVLNRVRMIELTQEAYLLEDVLPLLHGLLAEVGHLFDGNDLLGDGASRVINGAEAAVADLPEILEYLLRIILLEELGNLGIFQATGPRYSRHCNNAIAATLAPPGAPLKSRTSSPPTHTFGEPRTNTSHRKLSDPPPLLIRHSLSIHSYMEFLSSTYNKKTTIDTLVLILS